MTSREIVLCNGIIYSASAAATIIETIGWIMAKEFENQSAWA